MRRHEIRSTMMTSNRPIEDWGKLLGDVATATAILDRFLHHSDILTITGKSYRLRNRRKGPKPAKAPIGSKKNGKQAKPAKAPPGSADLGILRGGALITVTFICIGMHSNITP
jgi:hypothetical protein